MWVPFLDCCNFGCRVLLCLVGGVVFKLFGDGVFFLTIGGSFNNSFGVVLKLYVVVVTLMGTVF